MSVYADSLKKQNAFLQTEIERYANAVDNLSVQLAQERERSAALEQQLLEERAAADTLPLPLDQNSS